MHKYHTYMHAHTHAGMHESTSGLLAQTLTFRPTLRQQRELLRLVLATQDIRGVQTGAVLQSMAIRAHGKNSTRSVYMN